MALQPLITDDTGTQSAGGNQIELALNRLKLESLGEATRTQTASLVYTRGLTDALDAYGGVNQQRIRASAAGANADGSGNPLLGLKWRWWEDEAAKRSLALKPELQLGISTDAERRGLGSGRTGYGASIILTQETAFGAVHANLAANRVGYALPENQAAHRKALYRLSVAPVVDVAENFKLVFDLGLATHPHREQRARSGYAELGAILNLGKNLDVAFGYVSNLADGEPRARTLTAGITWRAM
ncbi:MAG: transporter [Burkholderiales bacterium]|nr:transporter [Burkholderiales bacterium]